MQSVMTVWRKSFQTCPECNIREEPAELFQIFQRIPTERPDSTFFGDGSERVLGWTLGLPAQHALWIIAEGTRHANTPGMNIVDVTEEEVRQAINSWKNWRGPGLDRDQNFWYKKFTSVHSRLAHNINKVMSRPEEFPSFLTAGIIYLIPKKDTV